MVNRAFHDFEHFRKIIPGGMENEIKHHQLSCYKCHRDRLYHIYDICPLWNTYFMRKPSF